VVSAVDVPSATYAKSSGIGAAMMRAHAQFKSGVTPTDASLGHKTAAKRPRETGSLRELAEGESAKQPSYIVRSSSPISVKCSAAQLLSSARSAIVRSRLPQAMIFLGTSLGTELGSR
jgi:hypothetical protein